jgi:hypothetical protein
MKVSGLKSFKFKPISPYPRTHGANADNKSKKSPE